MPAVQMGSWEGSLQRFYNHLRRVSAWRADREGVGYVRVRPSYFIKVRALTAPNVGALKCSPVDEIRSFGVFIVYFAFVAAACRRQHDSVAESLAAGVAVASDLSCARSFGASKGKCIAFMPDPYGTCNSKWDNLRSMGTIGILR